MKNDVLVTINGVPVITKSDLEKEKEYWAKDPQLQELDNAVFDEGDKDNEYIGSSAFVQNCLNGLIRDAIIEHYILVNKIKETAEYQERLKHAIDNLHKEILWETVKVPITEGELRVLHEEWATGRSFEEDRAMLEKYLRRRKFGSYLDERIEQLKQEFNVKINEDFLK